MTSIVRFMSMVKTAYMNLNPSTLTGAIDVLVVKQDDGTFLCTPFHVRFGKLGVLQSRQNKVYIIINGNPVEDLYMQLGEAGQAIFVTESEEISNELNSTPSSDGNNKQTGSVPSVFDETEQTLNPIESGNSSTSLNNRHRSKPLSINNRLDESTDDEQKIDENTRSMKRASRSRKRNGNSSNSIREQNLPQTTSVIRDRSPSENHRPVFHLDGDDDLELNQSSPCSTPFSDAHSRLNSIDSRQKHFQHNLEKKSSLTENEPETDSASEDNSLLDQQIPVKTTRTSSNPIPIEQINKIEPMSPLEELNSIMNPLFSQSAPICLRIDSKQSLINRVNSTNENSTNDFTSIGSLPNETDLRPTSPKSDTEYELDKASQQTTIKNTPGARWRWNWGEFPKFWSLSSSKTNVPTQKKNTPSNEGVYLDDIANNKCDDPSLYLLQVDYNQKQGTFIKDEDQESGTGASLPHSPFLNDSKHEFSYLFGDVQLSLCGKFQKLEEIDDDLFNSNLISYEAFSTNPSIINDPGLIVRINGKFYTWDVASTLIASTSIYQRSLPVDIIEKLQEKPMVNSKSRLSSGSGSWWPFSGRKQSETTEGSSPSAATEALAFVVKSEVVPTIGKRTELTKKISNENEQEDAEVTRLTEKIAEQQSKSSVNAKSPKKAMVLTSEQIRKLNLHYGKNQAEFSVTTALQGTTVVEANIFLFDSNTKFVISDIDGTITKSDVFGHILPLVGKDWSHDGITPFFQAIQENGYQFIYLSARAIGQSRITRNYLKSLKQCSSGLPDGPLLISPDNLVAALYREVIAKEPEKFKIECLNNIKSLFPGKNPFYAGFGNRINDQSAYTAVGIPDSRIFTINPRGEVVREKVSQVLLTSYKNLHEIVDQIFPPMDSFSAADSFSSFTFWRPNPIKDDFLEEEMRQNLQEILKRQKSKSRIPSSPSSVVPLSSSAQ